MGNKIIGANEQQNVRQGGILQKIFIVITPLLIILLFVFLGFGLKAMSKKPEIKKRVRPTLAVMATTAVSDTVQLTVNVQGESRPRTEIDIVPEVGGKVVYVSPKFISGGLFTKGEELFRIDTSDYQVAVVRAQATVARAQQVLMREESEGAIAKLDWADLGNGKQASELTLRKPQLLEAQASLQSAQADLDNAKIRLQRTSVRAPFNGRVRDKIADIGQYVNPGSRLGRVFSTDIAEVRLALSDADIARINLPLAFVAKERKTAPNVTLSTAIGGQVHTWQGKIMRTDAAYDPQTRSMFAIAEVVDPYGKGAANGNLPLAPGLFVDAKIEGKTLDDVIIIPRDALRPENKVYTVDEKGIATSNDVIVLDTSPERAVIYSGLTAGDLVIVSPLEKSQISLNFKVLDAANPETVLIEPPKPKGDKKDDVPADVKAAKKKLEQAKKDFMTARKEYSEAKKNAKKKNGKNNKKNKSAQEDDPKSSDKKANSNKDAVETKTKSGAE